MLKTSANKLVDNWSQSPKGDFLLYEEAGEQGRSEIWMVSLSDHKATRLIATPGYSNQDAAISPDGQWIAYTSDENGLRQVFVRTFPPSERKWQVSTGRIGAHPRWRSDGKQLFYVAGGTLNVVEVLPARPPEFKVGIPKPLSQGLLDIAPHNFAVADQGQRFLLVTARGSLASAALPIVVTMNWTSGLGLGR